MTHTKSGPAIAWVNSSIHQCLSSHQQCRMQASKRTSTPARLIEISGSGTEALSCKVVSTQRGSIIDQYLTLSYCWGATPGILLTKDKYLAFQHSIPIEELPKTVEDALHATQALGFKYIWIDRLCIIQDDDEDWKREAAQMCNVYGQSALTIAALSARSTADGLFTSRKPFVHEACMLATMKNGTKWFTRPGYWKDARGDHFIKSPLLQRGWVFQERILSTRVIHFGSEFMPLVWECYEEMKTYAAQELDPSRFDIPSHEHPFYWFPKDIILKSDMPDLESLVNSYGTFKSPQSLIDWWCHIVIVYTHAALTFDNDRYAAIRGVVDSVKAKTGYQNHAGLWEPLFLQQLTWREAKKATYFENTIVEHQLGPG